MSFFFMVLALAGVFLGALWLFQERLVYFPSRELEATPADLGLPFAEVWLEAEDGARLHAWFIPAEHPRGAAVFCHGNAGNISHRLDTVRLAHGLGLDLLLFDYRGYGRSPGAPSEPGTYADARAAYGYLVREKGWDPRRVLAWGRSLGGAVAARLAAEREVGALIVESCFTSIPDMGAHVYPFLPVRLIARLHYDAEADIARARGPVLVAHSPQDEIIPFAFGERLLAAAPASKRFLRLRGDHNNGWLASGQDYVRALDAFLGESLGQGQTGR